MLSSASFVRLSEPVGGAREHDAGSHIGRPASVAAAIEEAE